MSRSTSSRTLLGVSLLCLLFLALIWVNYFRQKSFDRKDAIRFAIEKNSNLAVALEQYAISTLHNVDAVLQLVRMEYEREGKALELEKLVTKNILNDDTMAAIVILDERGHAVKSNTEFTDALASDVSASNAFIFHSKNSTDSLLISKPVVSETTGKPVIFISRRLHNRNGRFDGMVAVQIDPSTFTSFYAQAKLLPNDIISLIAPDGITYARRTGNIESSGENIIRSPLFKHVAQNPDSFYFASDAIKNVPTWFSYRRLKNYPIIATVGSSEQDIYAENAGMHARTKTPRIITSVLAILLSVLIAIALLLRQRAAQRLREEKERYERLLTEQMIAVQERERERIGRELHDNVSQVLTTVKLYLETASKQHEDPLIPRSMELINSSICEIRNLSHQLAAPTLGTRSLVDSIDALIEIVGFSNTLSIHFNHEGYSDRLMMSQKLALYRILQEQLNNIIKHADAGTIRIALHEQDDKIMLTVTDNGKGFATGRKTNGMGLNNMISRAKVFGGTVQIQSAPRKGCSVVVTMPIVVAPSEDAV